MPNEFYRALISATTEQEAKTILLALAEQKLIAGGLITKGNSVYWWKNKLVEKIYYNISVFIIESNKQRIIDTVKKIHQDDIPIIAFFKVDDGNTEFLEWISENTKSSYV